MNSQTLKVLEYHRIIDMLCDLAKSELGQNQIRSMRPFTDFQVIEQQIAETTELKVILAPNRSFPISGLCDLYPILKKLEKWEDVLSSEEILKVGSTIRAARKVKTSIQASGDNPHMDAIASTIGDFSKLEEAIEQVFESSGLIKDGASSKLKSIRKNVKIQKKRISAKIGGLIKAVGVGVYLQDENIRENQGRLTLAVTSQHAAKVKGTTRGQSDSGKTVFIEPEGIREMGDELEMAIYEEKLEIQRLLGDITDSIAKQKDELNVTLERLTHLDVTYAKVRMSRNFDMHPPTLNTDGIISFNSARHPLLIDLHDRGELDQVTPIDVRLGEEFNTLIVTGPNTGGKTLTLKTIGLLTLMAQSGMHIPAAEHSQLAVFQNIWADIGDEQSIEQSLSTFSSHLKHIAEILEHTDERCLVLLDELGGGTDPAEGAALASAILEYLHARQTRTVITTHISQLKTLAYTVKGMENASIEFDLKTLSPTYRLLTGMPGGSNALSLARRLKLPLEVIENAESHTTGDESTELLNELQAVRSDILTNQASTAASKKQTAALEAEARQRLDELSAQLELAKHQNGQFAFELLIDVQAQVEELLHREPSKKTILKALDEIQRNLDKGQRQIGDQSEDRPFQAGDQVHVLSLNKMGVLDSINEKSNTAIVECGGLNITIPLSDLELKK
jgi:DNA mismatch repair protein MutS2